jgi:hypothetical protein
MKQLKGKKKKEFRAMPLQALDVLVWPYTGTD